MAAVLLMVGQHLEQPEIVQQLLDVQLTPCKPQYNYASEVRGTWASHHSLLKSEGEALER